MVHHEALLIISDDRANAPEGTQAIYAIYKRSENRILQIVRTPEPVLMELAA